MGSSSAYGAAATGSPYNQGSAYTPTSGAYNAYGNQQTPETQQSFPNNGVTANNSMGNFGGPSANYGGEQGPVNYPEIGASQPNAAATTADAENANAGPAQEGDSSPQAEKYNAEDSAASASSPDSTPKQDEKLATAANDGAASENVKRRETMLEKLDKHLNGNAEKSSVENSLDGGKGDSQEFQETEGDNSSSGAVFSDDVEEFTSEEPAESEDNPDEYAPSMQDTEEGWKDDDASLHNVPLGKSLPHHNGHDKTSADQDQKLRSKDF
jgi:hypothetical protein